MATERGVEETERAAERGVEALRRQTVRVEEIGREGMRQANKASAAAFAGVARTGSTLTDVTQEIVGTWARYAQDVMRNTSEASQALSRSRTISAMMQVQIALMRDNIHSFLDQSAKLADTASRTRSKRRAGSELNRRRPANGYRRHRKAMAKPLTPLAVGKAAPSAVSSYRPCSVLCRRLRPTSAFSRARNPRDDVAVFRHNCSRFMLSPSSRSKTPRRSAGSPPRID
jgi:Phasin protein